MFATTRPARARQALGRLVDPRPAALVVLGLLGVLAIANLRSGRFVNHVAGAWIEQAESVRQGHFYLPISGGGEIGGTRYLPLPIAVHGLVVRLVGDPVLAGKLISFVTMAAVVLVAMRVLVVVRAPRHLAPALVVLPFLTGPGLEALLGIRHDLGPTLSFLAIALLVMRERVRAPFGVGALIGIALLCKSSAVWVALAVAVTLLARREIRALLKVIVASAFTLVAGFAVAHLWSDGRVWDNLGLSSGDVTTARLLAAPRGFVDLVLGSSGVMLPVVLIAVAEVVWAIRSRTWTLLHAGLVANAAVVVLLTADPGVAANHLVDLFVISALAAGSFARRVVDATVMRVDVARPAHVVWVAALLLGVVGPLYPDARALASSVRHGDVFPDWRDDDVLADLVLPSTVVLSDDPMVARRVGRTPRLADAFMLRHVMADDPEIAEALEAEITGHHYEYLVLLNPLEDTGPYGAMNFGRELRATMRANYELVDIQGGYWIYQPRVTPLGDTSAARNVGASGNPGDPRSGR